MEAARLAGLACNVVHSGTDMTENGHFDPNLAAMQVHNYLCNNGLCRY